MGRNQDLTALMTYALDEEFKRKSEERRISDLVQQEAVGSYLNVTKLTRLITSDTRWL
jgi:hypothetical protein